MSTGSNTGIKICGLRDSETVRQLAGLPIDYVGLVFAQSRRQVTAEEAGKWIRLLANADGGQRPQYAGVFVNPEVGQLGGILEDAPLDIVQLHGMESASICHEIKQKYSVAVWKVFDVADSVSEDTVALQLQPYFGAIDAVMLDTAGGGTGKTFRWEAIPVYKQWALDHGLPVIVAGGLHADNVQELIRDYGPTAVDVSSGVETNGVKDIAKIRTFVERVKMHV